MYGRGGAGNLQAVAQRKERAASDLEANENVDEALSAGNEIEVSQRETQQYVQAGRGGAGNYHAASDIKEQQLLKHIPSSKLVEAFQEEGSRTAGRGGAGNYYFAAIKAKEAAALDKAKEDLSRAKISQDVEKGVRDQLAMPQQARLAQNRTLKQ